MSVSLKFCLFFLVAAVLSACAPEAVVSKDRFFWPPPPDTPRIEWLNAYQSQLDLKMTPLRRIRESITGEEKPILLKRPVDVCGVPLQEKFYVADVEEGGIYVYDLERSDLRMLSTSGSDLPSRLNPTAMALDRDNNLYVLEPRLLKILVFNSDEKYVRSISIISKCKRPVAIAIDKGRERLYVADVQLNKIIALDLNGAELFSFGASGAGMGEFNRPVGIAIALSGNIIIADAFNARIQIFNEAGKYLREFGKRGDGVGNFQLIKSVAVDPDDNIYVADSRNHSISIFNQSGALLTVFGGFYSVAGTGKRAPGGFSLPVKIDIDSMGRIYVVDQMNARIQSFQYLSESASSATRSALPAK